MGQNPFYYTKACKLMGKGVRTSLVELGQARHAQCLDRVENGAAGYASLQMQQVMSQQNN